jgi:nucleoside-diphosphate-sugar epimerase
MSKPKRIFVTGATGFLGSHLTARLLDLGHDVTALGRGSKTTSAEDRVRDVLRDVGTSSFERLTVLEGDISLGGLGLSEAAKKQVISSTEETWHCAASLSFLQEDRDEIFRMNVGGTLHLLELVKQTPTQRLHHVSTAYVAGNRPDVSLETEINVGQTFKNPYEESKCQAEMLIADELRKRTIVASVYRPSIVIGDSRSGRVTHFHGVYAFIRALWATLERLRRKVPEGGVVHLPLRVLGAETQTLNFVPIDYVVDAMVAISERPDSVGNTYHLANPDPTENRLWLPNVCRLLQVDGIHLVEPNCFLKTPMSKLETIFQKQMAFYYQYLQRGPRFDCRRALDALKNTGVECPRVTAEFIDKMVGWYVNMLNAKAT